MKYLSFLVSLLVLNAFAQNLNEERIWKIAPKKKAIYLSHGVFHLNEGKTATIKSIRSSTAPDRDYERVVVDFEGASVPKVYGHISEANKKITIDFFETSVVPQLNSLKNTRNVKAVDFLAIDQSQVTMELQLKEKLNYDVFYLENPGRLVIDIRK